MEQTREKLITIIEQAQREAKDTIGSMNNGFAAWYADKLLEADVVPVVHGEWINIPAYIGADGKLHKAQECSVCKAFFVSDPNKPYSNHPYCAECGAKMGRGTS